MAERGQVIPFKPDYKRSCWLCAHLMSSEDRMYCPVFGQEIYLPIADAADCPAYEPDPLND